MTETGRILTVIASQGKTLTQGIHCTLNLTHVASPPTIIDLTYMR